MIGYIRPLKPDEIYHSAKGSTWKDHKYIRKEGKRYIYKEDPKSNVNKLKDRGVATASQLVTNAITLHENAEDWMKARLGAEKEYMNGEITEDEYNRIKKQQEAAMEWYDEAVERLRETGILGQTIDPHKVYLKSYKNKKN